MRLKSSSGLNTIAAQYRLTTLLAVVSLLCACLAFWAPRERRYRAQLAAVTVLARSGAEVGVQVDNPDPHSSLGLIRNGESLRRGETVIDVCAAHSSLSDDEVAAILCFPKLAMLDLSGAWVTDRQLLKIAEIPSLEDLDLSYSNVNDEGIPHLGALRSLRALKLTSTRISDSAVRHLSGLHNLEELDLGGTDVGDEGVLSLSALRSLRDLDLSGTKISDAALVHLARLDALEKLRLHGDAIGDTELGRLASLPNLAALSLGATGVSDNGLKTLERSRSLKALDISGCAVTDEGLVGLASLISLREIVIYDSSLITAAGVAQLRTLRPNLDIRWGDRSKSPPSAEELARWAALGDTDGRRQGTPAERFGFTSRASTRLTSIEFGLGAVWLAFVVVSIMLTRRRIISRREIKSGNAVGEEEGCKGVGVKGVRSLF